MSNKDNSDTRDGSNILSFGMNIIFILIIGGGIFFFIYFVGGIVVSVVTELVTSVCQFITEPNLFQRSIDCIKAFVLVCGGTILFFIVYAFLYDLLGPEKYVDDSDDYHASRGL